ncbi:MAG: CzcE family metal-binding protein [Pseudomonadota bacterium]
MKTLRTHLISLAIAGAFTAAAPAFANHPMASPNLGTPVHDGSADRTIALGADAKWVNVTGGETIKFVVGGKSFSWRFDTFSTSPVFELDKIAPAGMLDGRSIKVYVSPDPQQTSG